MTRSPPLYEEDFFVWTQQQAAALRRLSPDRLDGGIDIEHLAEEVEDLGRRDLREVNSLLARLIEHLIKIDACPRSLDQAHWRAEAVHFQNAAAEAFSPGMRQLLSAKKIWTNGRKAASQYLRAIGSEAYAASDCPLDLQALLAGDFDLDEALDKLGTARRR